MAGKRISQLPQKPAQAGDFLAADNLAQGTYRLPLGQGGGVPMLDAGGALASPRAYLDRGTVQFDAANWNTIGAAGVYEVAAGGSGGTNSPPTARKQGALIVHATPTTVVQLYVPSTPGDIYIRTAYNNTFTAWQTVGGGLAAFNHTQNTAAATWTINHNLGYYPDVHVYSTGGSELVAEIVHTSANQTIVYLAAPMAGRARCV